MTAQHYYARHSRELKHDLLDRADSIARTAGGFLGFGNRVGKAERQMLDELASAFD